MGGLENPVFHWCEQNETKHGECAIVPEELVLLESRISSDSTSTPPTGLHQFQ